MTATSAPRTSINAGVRPGGPIRFRFRGCDDFAPGILHQAQDGEGTPVKHCTGRSRVDAARMANRQGNPEILLELPDLYAQCRLRNMQLAGGARHVPGFDDLAKYLSWRRFMASAECRTNGRMLFARREPA
jgi:hypothetical protein